MITLLGTGHVFDISEPVMFITKHIWPEAVLVELDPGRFKAMTAPRAVPEQGTTGEKPKEAPALYKKTAKYQNRMADERGIAPGSEFLVAINTGRMLGAEIGFIDRNAAEVMTEIQEEMSFGERFRYSLSGIKDRIGGRRDVERTVEEFAVKEEEMMADMRRRFPTLVRKLIDERNVHMAGEILKYSERFDNILVVVGDAHVEGLATLLPGMEIKKIRLQDILDKGRLDAIRAELWNNKVTPDES